MGWQRAKLNEDIFIEGMRFFDFAQRYVMKDMPWYQKMFIEWFANWRVKGIFQRYDPMIAEEINGIIDGLAGKVASEKIVRASAFFDLAMNYACTSFAVKGSATRNGRLLIGRNFDFGGAGSFDVPFITVYQPDEGYRFASFGVPVWNLSGVTSFNEKGLVVISHLAVVKDANLRAKPIGELIRKIVQGCATIDEALKLIEKTPRMCGLNLLLAEGPAQEAVVVELSAKDFAVRPMENDAVWATNHFVSKKIREQTSPNNYLFNFQMRFARMQQLITENRGRIDLETIVDFLRDRFAPNQNREVVNSHNICATYRTDYPFSPNNDLSIVFEPGSLDFWLSNSSEPAAMGEFIGFNLLDLFENQPSNTEPVSIAASTVPESDLFKRELSNYRTLVRAKESYKRKQYVNAIIDLGKVIEIDPVHIEAHYFLAYTYFRSEKWDLAKQYAHRVIEIEEQLEISPQFRGSTALAYLLLGRIAKKQGQKKQAEGFFQKTAALAEEFPHANNEYAAKLAEQYRYRFWEVF